MPANEPLLHLEPVSKVEVNPTAVRRAGLAGLELQVGAVALRIAQGNPAVLRRRPGNLVQCLLPKLNHTIEFATMNHHGADLHAGLRFEAIPTTRNQTADRFPSDALDHDPLEEQR
jgi:hypothetical protein